MKGIRMKKILPVLMSVLFVFTLFFCSIKTEATEARSGTLGENNEISWAYDGAGNLTIEGTGALPDFSSTNMPWYRHYRTMKTVTIGEGITHIGKNAFHDFYELTTVNIQSAGCTIGETAFSESEKLTTLNAPKGLGNVGYKAFYKCKALTSVTFSNTATAIGDNAFVECKALTAVTLPESVALIGEFAFQYCENLESLTVKNPNAHIDAAAFQYTSKLTDVTIPRTVTYDNYVFSGSAWAKYFGKCGTDVFWLIQDGMITIYGTGAMSSAPAPSAEIRETVKEIVIEDGVTKIYGASFQNFSNAVKATISNTVTEIGNSTFRSTGLTTLEIPESVTTIEHYAFANNANLTDLTIPETVTSLGGYFISGSGVENLVLKADLTYTSAMFDNCATLENVILEKGKTESYLFSDSRSTLKNLTIGAGVETIAVYAFGESTALQTLTIENGACTEIGNMAFCRCTALKEVVIPENIVMVGEKAFIECSSLQKVTFYENLKEIGAYAFAECTALKEAEIPLSVETIGDYAFNGVLSDEIGKEDIYIGGGDFTLRGYINTAAEKYAADRRFHVTFEPLGGDISVCKMTLNPSSFTYDGTAKEPEVTVKTPLSGTELVCGTMYTEPVYADNIEPGNASVTVTGIGNWTGTLSKTFTISKDGSSGGEKPEQPENPTISEEEMMMMKELLTEYGIITPDTVKFTEREYEMTIMVFAENGYSVADAEFFMKRFGYWGNSSSAEDSFGEEPVYRVSGASRYETSYKTADVLKEQLGVDKFDTAIIAYGKNFPDALAGSYLAGKTNAPILMINKNYVDELTAYVKANVKKGGKVYVLGGEGAIPNSQLNGLGEYDLCRLAGQTRYETNLKILEEAGMKDDDILVCTGKTFADSLSASATGKPIFLVNNKALTAEQKEFLARHAGSKFYIIGGTGAVSEVMADEIRQYGSVERIYGSSRYETSVKLAEKFFSDAKVSVLASAKNFPDGLCGGPLAMSKNAPLILTATGKEAAAVEYMRNNSIGIGAVLGGDTLISDDVVEEIYDVPSISTW